MSGVTFVLLSTGLVTGVTVVLAALLLVAERYLANYGPCAIDINRGSKRLEVQGGRSLLASLMAEGIFIPSACGGRGTCAYCKVGLLEGGPPLAPTELPLLTEQEQKSSIRLSCQVKVRNDLAITIPEELFAVREYTGVVERIRDLTPDIKELRIRLSEPETIDFVAGQYVQLEAPAYGDNPEPVYRAYSVSSPPSDPRAVELIIRLVPGGICTTWVFTILKEGDAVRFNGPYGKFRLSDSDRPMVWVAGGSGMAPFWGMARHMAEHGVQRPVNYFFGAARTRDMFLVDEFRAIGKQLPHFRFIPALSGQPEDDGWTGERGLITAVADRHVPAGADQEGYLCGSSGLIDASIKVLKAKGIPEERIFFDKFTQDPSMKQSPDTARIAQKMAPGVLSRAGFLGTDRRPLEEILDADRSAVVGLGTSHEAIAARLRAIFDQAEEAMGNVVRLSDYLTAFHCEAMGRIPCPFGACGTFHKGQVDLTDRRTGATLVVTPLGIHLIEAHGFYQGRGSAYRIEPAAACRLFGG